MKLYRIFCFCFASLLLATLSASAEQALPEKLYPALEYLLTLPASQDAPSVDKIGDIIGFVAGTPSGTSMDMRERNDATGAFRSFDVRSSMSRILQYVYNPDIPVYVTMPSSVRSQRWRSDATRRDMARLPDALASGQTVLVRGLEQETITPDANTGGYYAYDQDRAVLLFAGPTGPVLISVGCQPESSEVGRKGCVVGKDSDWNYLYSEEKGLNKTGLGWVDSYMYNAHSVLIFVADDKAGVIHAGSFKWLNAGWAGMNMVKPVHIVNGIVRFAADFKAVLESRTLPAAKDLEQRFRTLAADSDDQLRSMVAPYLKALAGMDDAAVTSAPFEDLLASGEYLRTMSKDEMVKVLLQDYVKKSIGRASLMQVADLSGQPGKP